MPAEQRAELKQVVRAAAVDARSTSKKLLVRQVKQGSVRGLRCCCSLGGHGKGLLHAECFGQLWIGMDQPLAMPDSSVTREGGKVTMCLIF